VAAAQRQASRSRVREATCEPGHLRPTPRPEIVRLLFLVALAACGGTGARPDPPPPEAIAGLWRVEDGSDVVVRVSLEGGAPRVEAPGFEVTGVSYQGRHLRATFRHLANGVTTTSDVVLVGRFRLEGTVSGAYSGRETWLRMEPDAGGGR
jgi:hypothetical protein